MKKLLATVALAALALCGANAQTDVTRYYITNYGFDDNFDYKSGETTAVAREILDVPGWTAGHSSKFTIAGRV